MFPKAKALAILKEPVWRMRSAYRQFSANFAEDCKPNAPRPWCPIYRYYSLKIPSYAEVLRADIDYLRATGVALFPASYCHQPKSVCCFTMSASGKPQAISFDKATAAPQLHAKLVLEPKYHLFCHPMLPMPMQFVVHMYDTSPRNYQKRLSEKI